MVFGGSFYLRSSIVRSAFRSLNQPAARVIYLGFRAARTYSLSSKPPVADEAEICGEKFESRRHGSAECE